LHFFPLYQDSPLPQAGSQGILCNQIKDLAAHVTARTQRKSFQMKDLQRLMQVRDEDNGSANKHSPMPRGAGWG
jgi:hypothetical protein